MKIENRHRRYQWLIDNRSAWSLLRKDNAPLILAFLGELFEGNSEVAVDLARVELDLYLQKHPTTSLEPGKSARIYLNQWVDAGYLREQNQKFMLTSLAQAALEFAESFERREVKASASHLETVTREIHRLLVDLSPDIAERQQLIDEQIAELERAKQNLMDGRLTELNSVQKEERVRHLYSLAMSLTHDFRYLEDEMSDHEVTIRQKVLEEDQTRGAVLEGLLDAEDLLGQSRAGQAFESFYALMASEEHSQVFRAQIKRLMKLGVAEFLTPDEARYFRDLVSQLLTQSEQVIRRRRLAIQSLKGFILSGAKAENRIVDGFIKEAKALASKMQTSEAVDWNAYTGVTLLTGRARFSSPSTLVMTWPDEVEEEGEIVDERPGQMLDPHDLEQFRHLRVEDVAHRVRDVLNRTGPRTLGDLTVIDPIRGGVEEVIALLRIAEALNAVQFDGQTEEIFFTDESRRLMKATVPTYLMTAEKFPVDLSELNP